MTPPSYVAKPSQARGEMSTSEVYVVDAVRTPIGKIGGALAHVRPDDMAAATISSLMERTPDLDPTLIDDVHFGNGNGAGEENRNVARMASLLVSKNGLHESGRQPLARIVSRAVSGIEPHRFGIGPVVAVEAALARAGITWGDLAVVELNEAFTAQSLACLCHWPDLDPDIVNPSGGAIALGHPVGASGVRIMTTLTHSLRRRRGGYGLATMCIGVGQGIAVVVEGL